MGLYAEGGGGSGRSWRDLSCHMESSLCGRRGVSDGGESQRAFTSEHLHCAVSFCLRLVCSDKPPQARVLPTQRPAQVGAPTYNLGPESVVGPVSAQRSGEFHAHVANKL